MKDHNGRLLRGSIAGDQFRLFAAETTNIVQTARDLHDLYPLPSLLMGRMISGVALMSGELKAPRSQISIRVDAEGPLKGAIVIASKEGDIKAFAFEPQFWAEQPESNFRVGEHLGKGSLSVIRQSGLKAPYTGRIELIDGEIASDLAAFYDKSEQTATAVNLGVLIDADARVRAAGGILIQQLPNADPEIAEHISINLAQTPNISDLMDMGLSLEDILNKFVLKGLQWKINKETPLRYHCDCSRERFARGLLLLGKAELETMLEGIDPVCHYCNNSYPFSGEDIRNLIKSLEEHDKTL
jgi:molecular chaperone Hsp33